MQKSSRVDAFLALGANLGSPAAQLRAAVEALGKLGEVAQLSLVYRTTPVGFADQPDFLNMVCRVETILPPERLLFATAAIEAEMGRERGMDNGPRVIDIDVLSHGEAVLETRALSLPHPRLHQRAFVLVPLAEIAPGWRHPVLGKTAAELLRSIAPVEGITRLGGLHELGDLEA